MKNNLILMILHFSFLLSGQIDSSMLKISVDLKDYRSSHFESGFEGCLRITNTSNHRLKLPRYFDLGYSLNDEKGNPIPHKDDAIYEYALKVKLQRRRIKPNETIEVVFIEDRLFNENDINKEQTYYIQYFLLHKHFLPNIKSDRIRISFRDFSSNQ